MIRLLPFVVFLFLPSASGGEDGLPPEANNPRDALLRFVPEDVGFCLVVEDLRAHTKTLARSPFTKAFWRSAPGRALAESKEWKQLDKADRELRTALGLGWREIRDDILGTAVVFAYRPGPPEKPEEEQGLILLHARKGQTFEKLLERINTAQKHSGEVIGLSTSEYKGVRYFTRVEANKKRTHYFLRGPILVFSAQEQLLREAIEQDQRLRDSLSPVARRLGNLGSGHPLLLCWLNPRVFDRSLEAEIRGANPRRAAGLATFARYWKAIEDVAFKVELQKELSLSFIVRGRSEELPPPVRRLLKVSGQASDFWRIVPEEPLLAVAGRTDLGALVEVLLGFMSDEEQQKARMALENSLGAFLGKNVFAEVLPALGPDWGFCLDAPPPLSPRNHCFPDSLVAVRIASGDPADPFDQALYSALLFPARMLVLGHNSKNPDRPLVLRTERVGTRRMTVLTGPKALPPGVQPTFGLHSGYLILASSPDAVRRFHAAAADRLVPRDTTSIPLLRVSFRKWQSYLSTRREPLARAVAAKHQLSLEQANRRLGHLLSLLPLLDRLELRQQTSPGRLELTLTLCPTYPLSP
jgi:hypothetical protein